MWYLAQDITLLGLNTSHVCCLFSRRKHVWFFYTHRHQKHKCLARGQAQWVARTSNNPRRPGGHLKCGCIPQCSQICSSKTSKKTSQLALRRPDTLWQTAIRNWCSHQETISKPYKLAWCLWKVVLCVLVGEKTHYKVDAVRQSPAACSMIDWAIKNMSGITHGTL